MSEDLKQLEKIISDFCQPRGIEIAVSTNLGEKVHSYISRDFPVEAIEELKNLFSEYARLKSQTFTFEDLISAAFGREKVKHGEQEIKTEIGHFFKKFSDECHEKGYEMLALVGDPSKKQMAGHLCESISNEVLYEMARKIEALMARRMGEKPFDEFSPEDDLMELLKNIPKGQA